MGNKQSLAYNNATITWNKVSGWHCKVILCTAEESNCKLCVSKAGPDLAHPEGPAHLLDVTHALL